MNAEEKLTHCFKNLKDHIPYTPKIALVLGSGLGDLADGLQVDVVIPYASIRNFPLSTAPGHRGAFVFAKIDGIPVVIMQGRIHYYEGYPMTDVVLPIRIMKLMGAEILFLTNAAGGVNKNFSAGNFMLITDHINLMPNPLIGPNDDTLGPRFPTMHAAYDPEGLELARLAAKHTGVKLHEGCYLGTTGPAYETPHEYHFYHTVGADAVGMSTVPEVIVANHCGVKVLAFSMISNVGGLHHHVALSHEEVQAVGAQASDNLARLLLEILPQL